ncbi:MAG: hypothetical protein ACLT5P_10210, partial [Flavonifractor plautii]
ATPSDTGVALDFVLPQGPSGPTGSTGVKGDIGATGPAPTITVEESTPTTYRVRFHSSGADVISPNLRAAPEVYNMDLSATGSTRDIPLGKLILNVQNGSSSSIRLSLRAANTAAPVLVDLRRTTIYDGSTIESQTWNSVPFSTSQIIDDVLYDNSQETHWMRLRQQDPATSLWSMCQITTFASAAGARVSIIVDWYYTGPPLPPHGLNAEGRARGWGAPLLWAAVPWPLRPTSATASGGPSSEARREPPHKRL